MAVTRPRSTHYLIHRPTRETNPDLKRSAPHVRMAQVSWLRYINQYSLPDAVLIEVSATPSTNPGRVVKRLDGTALRVSH